MTGFRSADIAGDRMMMAAGHQSRKAGRGRHRRDHGGNG